ncbi:uncharacterized protein METZ01_LOCUS137579 [marine metagenome]|uniref:Uncharacterized protein n=1 Tax=marine metagenome TaxID=408172 RepID=A0A381Z602_9ZZZZ
MDDCGCATGTGSAPRVGRSVAKSSISSSWATPVPYSFQYDSLSQINIAYVSVRDASASCCEFDQLPGFLQGW